MKSQSYTTEVCFYTSRGKEIIAEMTFSVSPACTGSYQDGLKMEPDSPAEIEDIRITLPENMPGDVEAELEEMAIEHVEDYKRGFV